MGIFKFLNNPISAGTTSVASIVKDISGVLRDPNGKISSRRAGAGACITAAIATLTNATDNRQLLVGGSLLVAGLVLYGMTKWDTTTPDEPGK